ncbi:pantoate--beta-alanine ligase [Metabacillus litoralis]|uniref:pantoate--beta-alanine ligase n=1 Tax=Metabacillus litoralis TaxID=152268 RepID=UPI001CFE34EF|nr:pantoate--beta-alanine ligase [Metabacillus litoralis]
MKKVETKNELINEMMRFKQQNKSIGFVPTMGFLHEGHLTLIEEAKKDNQIVILSIFVNPLQFGPTEDFDSYPRDKKRDEELALKAGVDLIFSPSVEEMYPTEPSYTVNVRDRVNVLCGKSREGHFNGVATVLTKLFNLIRPNKAYFGMKDAQQVAVIEGLISEFHFPIEIVPVATIREEDGLAKSSRNVYLNELERHQASALYRSLLKARDDINNGERNIDQIKKQVQQMIMKETTGKIDYVEVLSYPELKEMKVIKGKFILAVAVKFTNARLIDNITMEV